MDDLTSQPWFGWMIVAVVALPVATVALTELHASLVRRRSSMAGPVHLLRTYLLPAATLLILLRNIPNDSVSNDGDWVRVTATIVGFLILVFVLASLNAALFVDAAEGSWRKRMPSIFIDLFRVVLIGTGLAFLFSWVWGTDIGGLFAALGVTTIVLGFALQNAVGSIVSGLLLLFEQPFQLGDWLEFGVVKGRVVEVNWRSVHIESGNGTQIVPNALLAGGTFTNLSRPTADHVESVATEFAEEDPPLAVIALLDEVAAGLTGLHRGRAPSSVRTGPGAYATRIPVHSLGDAASTRAQFEVRLWYAARRRNLRLNGADVFAGEDRDDILALARRFSPALHLSADRVENAAQGMDLERYAAGEVIMRGNDVPEAVRYVAAGQISMLVSPSPGELLSVMTLEPGDSLGQTALTRTATVYTAIAHTEVSVLVIPRDVIDELVSESPQLAREVGRQIEALRQAAAEKLGVPLNQLSARLRTVA